jgi:hypothetical protein
MMKTAVNFFEKKKNKNKTLLFLFKHVRWSRNKNLKFSMCNRCLSFCFGDLFLTRSKFFSAVIVKYQSVVREGVVVAHGGPPVGLEFDPQQPAPDLAGPADNLNKLTCVRVFTHILAFKIVDSPKIYVKTWVNFFCLFFQLTSPWWRVPILSEP